jgi:hypothetical protein
LSVGAVQLRSISDVEMAVAVNPVGDCGTVYVWPEAEKESDIAKNDILNNKTGIPKPIILLFNPNQFRKIKTR